MFHEQLPLPVPCSCASPSFRGAWTISSPCEMAATPISRGPTFYIRVPERIRPSNIFTRRSRMKTLGSSLYGAKENHLFSQSLHSADIGGISDSPSFPRYCHRTSNYNNWRGRVHRFQLDLFVRLPLTSRNKYFTTYSLSLSLP
jgi:hypothetical protein